MPGTSIEKLTEPRRPILTVSPSFVCEVGSPIRIMSGRMSRSAIQTMIARGDHVEMAGKAEMGVARAAAGVQILDRSVGRAAGMEAMNLEAERRQLGLEQVEGAGGKRGDAGAGDQPGGKVDRIDCACHRPRTSKGRSACTGRW